MEQGALLDHLRLEGRFINKVCREIHNFFILGEYHDSQLIAINKLLNKEVKRFLEINPFSKYDLWIRKELKMHIENPSNVRLSK